MTTYNLPKKYLSPSQIVRFMNCPACFYLEYVQKVPKPMSVNLPIGGAVHKAVETMRHALIERKHMEAKAADIAVQHFEHDGLGFDKESEVEVELDLGKYESLEKAKDDVARWATYAVDELVKLDAERRIIAAEVDLAEIDGADVWPFEMRGRIDALYGDSETMVPNLLGDLKTSSKQSAPDNAAAVQFSIYRYPFWKSGMELDILCDVLAKTKSPSLTTYSMRPADLEMQAVERLVLGVAEDISAGRFPPRPGWLCSYSHGFPAFSAAVEGFKVA